MNCRMHRAAWRDRVIADAESAEGRAVAWNHRVSLDLIDEVAARMPATSRVARSW